MDKSFLVTGGAGYIGTALTKRLISEGAQVTIFDSLETGQRRLVDPRAHFFKGDVRNREDLEYICSSNNFDTVIHLAALKSVGEGEKAPANFINVNVSGTLNVLEVMRKKHISNLVFSSTAAVYEENLSGIYDEKCSLLPLSVYGSTKLMCEELIRQYQRLGHIGQSVIFRYFNLAGDSGLKFFDAYAQNIFPVIARTYLAGGDFSVFGDDYPTPDGTGIRDYIHLNDLIEAHVLSIKKNVSGIFNLGTQRGTSVKELIEKFNQHLEQPLKVHVVGRRPGDAAKAIADPSKAEHVFNWVAKAGIDEMIKSTIEAHNVI
ncbi:UDP-glucose-4-epimerase [Rhodobacteraceae bacterium HIMB11]|nr:UDP-glucose-4-epimerase [Rhodobacteraceae bacterium HIMB11]